MIEHSRSIEAMFDSVEKNRLVLKIYVRKKRGGEDICLLFCVI